MNPTTVTVWRRSQTGTDRRGEPVFERRPHTEPGALFAPTGAGSNGDVVDVDRQAAVSAPTLYFRGRFPDILPDDEVDVYGQRMVVVGRPERWHDPTGMGVEGTVVRLLHVEEGVA